MERKLIAVAVSSALALPMAAQAVEFSVSGQINRAIMVVDQEGYAKDGDVQHVDANSSNSRFRFTGSEELESGMTAGVQVEWAALNGSDADGLKADGTAKKTPNGSPTIRHANVYLSSAGGKLSIGQGSQATDGVAHADLGGAAFLGGATNWGSYACGDSPACLSNDGNRSAVLRYDTPAIGAVNISVSTGNDDFWDAQLSVAGSMGDSGYDVRVGYQDPSETVVASAAFSMGQGTSVAVAWSQSDAEDNDDFADEYQYVKLDHSYGDGSVGVYYKRGEEGDQEGSLWGIGVGHNLGAGTTAYAGWRNVEGDGLNDLSVIFAGMRVTFN